MRDHRSKGGFLVVILLLAIITNSSDRVSADTGHQCGAKEEAQCILEIGGKLKKL